MQLTNFDVERFLRENWQKKPAVIRNCVGFVEQSARTG
jgi:ribosomal protein L16 Arg81 hydroxylase